MFGDHATILQPEALKEEVRKLIGAVLEKMKIDARTKNQVAFRQGEVPIKSKRT